MQEFKLRASAGGKLATKPRAKEEKLSETSKSFLKEWLTAKIYGYEKEIKSKYLAKGIQVEDAAIDRAIQLLDLPFVLKNEQSFEDDFFKGTPDLVLEDKVIDIKSSWDCFTFPVFETEIPNKDYFYQLQIYMHLTGKKKASLVYVLIDTPLELISDWEEPKKYDNLEPKRLIKSFEVEYSPEVIELLKQRVLDAREFLSLINK